MRHLPFRLLFLCVLLPPLLYVSSLQLMEMGMEKRWTAGLRRALLTDSKSLLEGRIRIQDEIRRNVETFIAQCYASKLGVSPVIVVKTKTSGEWLYPDVGKGPFYRPGHEDFLPATSFPEATEALQIARENLRIMNEGLSVALDAQIPRDSWFANVLLAFFVSLFSSILYIAYRRSLHKERSKEAALVAANERLAQAQKELNAVIERETTYQEEIELLKMDLAVTSDKIRATQDEALAEMVGLEERLQESMVLKEKLEAEVNRLAGELERTGPSKKAASSKRMKQLDDTAKRFRTLYKNLDLDARAIEGFLDLPKELQLRAEELIHHMNVGTDNLTVKRKVFSKKGTDTAYECEFGYRGRLYWRKRTDAGTRILAIGTKNSQAKDLAYLESV